MLKNVVKITCQIWFSVLFISTFDPRRN